MKFRAVALSLAVACGDPAPPLSSPPLTTPSPARIDETAFVRVTRADPALLVLGDALCTAAPHECWRFVDGDPVGAKPLPIAATEVARSFELDGKPCRLGIDARLACGDPRLDATQIQLLRGDLLFGKRATRDLVAYYGDFDAPDKLRPITSLPAKLRQVSIAVRVGCALTESREVWCWSDPKRPRKRAVPPGVEEIVVVDPFGLCVRTAAGEVSCTPPVGTPGEVFCHRDRNECRHRPILENPKGPAFDPLTPLMARLVALPIGFAPSRFALTEYHVQPIVPDFTEEMFGDPRVGGCAIGPAGEVGCVLSCVAQGRGVYNVRGMPPVVDVKSDVKTGYGVTATGELWVWPRIPASCAEDPPPDEKPLAPFRGEVAARRAALPPIAHLSSLLHYDGRRKFGTEVRCATLRDGTVRCWEKGEPGGLGTVFDPATPSPPR